MLRYGTMQLGQPQHDDPLDQYLRGVTWDGGYWLDIRRLSDHDHSGGTHGGGLPGYSPIDHTHPSTTTGRWHFSTSTAVADPGLGYWSTNTGSILGATTVVFSTTTYEGTQGPAVAGVVQAGDLIYAQDQNDNTRWAKYRVEAAPTAFTGYTTTPVTVLSSGGLPVANNAITSVTFQLAGGGGGGTAADVSIAGDNGIAASEAVPNQFVLTTRISPDNGNALSLRTTGLFAVTPDLTGYLTQPTADSRYEQLSRKGQASGYAALDAGGLIPTSQLPPLAVTDTFTAANQAAMLALPAQRGDLCIRTDTGRTYVLAAEPATTLANWAEVMAAGQVTSVNGKTGTVSLNAADVGALTQSTADARYPLRTDADPFPTYLTQGEADLLYRPISYVTEVTITGDNGVGAVESPANTFALSTRLSPDSGNALVLRANGLYVSPAATDPSVLSRLSALETSVTALKVHTHRLSTWQTGTAAPTGGIP